MKALLLSAGRGVRFQPQTLKHSKMTLPFLTVPIIGYPLKFLEDLKIQSLLINTHYLQEQVEAEVLKLEPRFQKVSFSFEETLLGGAGTLLKNHAFFKDEDMLYLNGDAIFLGSEFFSEMKKQHKETKALITFLGVPDGLKKDLWADEEGWLSTGDNLRSYFFPGLALISPECFSLLNEGDENIFKSIVQRNLNRCRVFAHKDLEFFEVGFLSEYLKSTEKSLDELFQENSQKGAQLKGVLSRYRPDFQLKQIDEKHKLLTEDSLQDLKNVRVKNFGVIGQGCSFSQPVCIEESVIASHQSFNQKHLFQNLFI